MLIEAYQAKDNTFHWLDVVDPTGHEFEYLEKKYGLSPTWIKDCLDPKHLPKYEKLAHVDFIMLRSLDEKSSSTANTLRELTQKIAIFVGKNYIITLHRRERPYLAQIKEKWLKTIEIGAKGREGTKGEKGAERTERTEVAEEPEGAEGSEIETVLLPKLLARIIQGVIGSYSLALNRAENKLEEYELMFNNEASTSLSIQEKFALKSQAYVFKRILRLTLDILPKCKIISDHDPSLFQEIHESVESAFFETENILEHVNNLITLHLSLASHRTSQIIRVLTIISIFFLPLNFIIGFYIMTFDYIPWVRHAYAYPILMGIMILFCVLLYGIFKKKKWF